MKLMPYVLSLASILVACSEDIEPIGQKDCQMSRSTEINSDNVVKLNNIVMLNQCINHNSMMSRPSSIECLTNEVQDTILYVSKNGEHGWTIYSSDTRVPAIVAQAESGSFDDIMQIDGARLWIQSILNDMTLIRELPDEDLNFSQEEIETNKAFWLAVSNPDKYVKEKVLNNDYDFNSGNTTAKGHYELINRTYTSELYDSIPRLTETDWHQSEPYNIYCPLKSDNTTHAPAGCVAIAAAQVLYYLHYSINVPETAPSKAYCNGNVNSYQWAQTDYTTSIWDQMKISGVYAAPLIADIGRRINIQYSDNGSSAITQNLVNNVFAPYGITCSYDTFDTELLSSSLVNKIPVIVRAMAKVKDNGQTQNIGHAFIIDRYIRKRLKTTDYYEWVYDYVPPGTLIPSVPGKINVYYSSPSITYIGFNWGWGNDLNYGWYGVTEDWIDVQSRNWNLERHIIHDFHATNN